MIDEQPIPQHPRPAFTLTTIFIVSAGVLLVLIAAALGFIVGDFGKDLNDLENSTNASPLVEMAPLTTSPTPATQGIITGSLSYPSEGLPAGMKVCAVNQENKSEICTAEQIESDEEPYGVSYQIKVPAGTYLIYAQLPGQNQKAFYSEFVTCGLSADCPSHEPIPVEVAAGETANNVDPHDWYVIEP